nr:hypothetical protein BaRGS_034006 [Batillaria attramentaria]
MHIATTVPVWSGHTLCIVERDLKAKNEELEEVRVKLEQEQDSKQLQVSIQDANSKLQRAQDVGEKLRLENKKKTEQVEKLERNISHMEDRIRNLEIRDKIVGQKRRIVQAQTKIAELEKKIDDLKLQVRHELMKNENIERGLETIPHLKDDIRERDKRISQLETEIDQMSILLAASRKAVREFKDKIRDLEKGEAAGEGMRRELELAQHEVMTLKQLITGKDALLLRKGQALEQAKEIIESLPRTQDEKEKLKKIQQLLTKLADRDISTNPNNTNDSDFGSHSSLDTDSEISVSTRDQQLLAKAQLTARQKDEILASSITIGDRVTFTIPQKPPRYGRKKLGYIDCSKSAWSRKYCT